MDAGGGGGGDQQKKNVFYKQQQQRLQNISLNKELKADDLIKNILEKVDSDAKISKYYNTKSKPSPGMCLRAQRLVSFVLNLCFYSCHVQSSIVDHPAIDRHAATNRTHLLSPVNSTMFPPQHRDSQHLHSDMESGQSRQL